MSRYVSLQFLSDRPEDAEQFIEEYVLAAIDRVSEMDACESFSFAPSLNPETGERSAVTVTLAGDTDAIIDHERDRWESLKADGVISDWNEQMAPSEQEMEAMMGEQGKQMMMHISQLTAEMAKLAYETFDEAGTVPAAVETYPDEQREAPPVGWWGVLHTVTVQLNYTLDEELAAYQYGIEHTLRNFAEYEGEEAVDERIDDLIDALEGMREEVKDGRLET